MLPHVYDLTAPSPIGRATCAPTSRHVKVARIHFAKLRETPGIAFSSADAMQFRAKAWVEFA
jgi:hypothetical protein